MRDDIINRIIALSEEQIKDLLILIQLSEEANRASEVLLLTSA